MTEELKFFGTDRAELIGKLANSLLPDSPTGWTCTIEPKEENRSIDQNSLFYALYLDISKSELGLTLQDAKRHCKLYIGLRQILLLDKAYKKKHVDILKSMGALGEEQKMILMDYLPVTREFKKNQGSEYIDLIHREFAPQGVVFHEPNQMIGE